MSESAEATRDSGPAGGPARAAEGASEARAAVGTPTGQTPAAAASASRPVTPAPAAKPATAEAAPKPVTAASQPRPATPAPAAATTSTTTTTAVAPAAATTATAPAAAPRANRARPSRVRKARLRLARIDPWSVMKTAFLFSIAGGIMFWVATYVVWSVIQSSGLFQTINETVSSIVDNPNSPSKFNVERYISGNKVLGLAAILAFVDVVILTALATLGSFLYNLSATMLGGIEVTLAED